MTSVWLNQSNILFENEANINIGHCPLVIPKYEQPAI